MTEASPILLDALRFAVDAHAAVRQARKGTTFPDPAPHAAFRRQANHDRP
jgi:hypothetical protein